MWAKWRDSRLKGFAAPDGRRVRGVTNGSVLRELNLYSNMFTIARREWKWVVSSPLTDMGKPEDNAPRTRRPHTALRRSRRG